MKVFYAYFIINLINNKKISFRTFFHLCFLLLTAVTLGELFLQKIHLSAVQVTACTSILYYTTGSERSNYFQKILSFFFSSSLFFNLLSHFSLFNLSTFSLSFFFSFFLLLFSLRFLFFIFSRLQHFTA